MARFTKENTERARQLMGLYPVARSALIPMLHLAQEQDGWVTDDAMRHIAELLEITPAEVLGTCSFYEMFKREPVGKYLVNVCTNVSCLLLGAYELLDHLEAKLGTKPGGTTDDGVFTLDEVECIAACTQAPCVSVNYRVFGPLTHDAADTLLADLRAGRLESDVPPHGTTNRVRRDVRPGTRPAKPSAAPVAPESQETPPAGGPAPAGPPSKDETAPTRESPPAKKAAKTAKPAKVAKKATKTTKKKS